MSDSVGPHRWQPTRLLCPWDSPGKNTGVGCHFLLQCLKVKVKSLSCAQLLATSWNGAYQAPPSMGFSRQDSFLIAMAKTSNTVLNRYGKSEHLCLVPEAFLSVFGKSEHLCLVPEAFLSVFHHRHNILAMALL